MSLDEGCFQRCLVSDSIILKPHRIGRNVKDVLHAKLCEMFEGICSRHGYILPGSVKLHRTSPGSLEGANLNGDIRYDLQYHAMVCNPAIGAIISARVVNKSRFGFLLHSGAAPVGGDAVAPLSSIVETIVSRQATYTNASADTADPADRDAEREMLDLDLVQIGDMVNILVMGKKFLLNNRYISVVGKIVKRGPASTGSTTPGRAVPTIGDNKEEDLSVIAAAEDSADERDDATDDEIADDVTEAGSGEAGSGEESVDAMAPKKSKKVGGADIEDDSEASELSGTDSVGGERNDEDEDEEDEEDEDGGPPDEEVTDDDGTVLASDEDDLV